MFDKYFKNIIDSFMVHKIVGIYRPKDVHIGHRIYGFIIRLIFVDIFLVLQTLYLQGIKDIIEFADLLSMQLTWVSISSKSYIVILNYDKIGKILEDLRELLEIASENKPNFGHHIQNRMKSIRKVFIVYWSSCPFTIILSAIGSVSKAVDPPYKPHYLIYPPPFFNHEENYTYFFIMEFLEVIGPVIAATTAVVVDFLPVYFFSMGAGLLEELADQIGQIETELQVPKSTENNSLRVKAFENEHQKRSIDELTRCIQIHGKIKEYLVNVQRFVSPIIFIQVLVSTAVLCMSCYVISTFSPADPEFSRQITYMIPMVLQIFIQCFYGNEIMIATEQFSMSIFHSKWYHGCKEFRKAFNMLLIHATQPIVIMCGMIFRISLENFVTIGEVSYKFYAVMQNMNAKQQNK